ncbi:hypothetical protein [Aequorivita marina]|uniref:hypothetical protein n=1 Tax=Aequorivita marina TaxID=3073654 RepID=UPI0028746424|nr:hypothetical protein [Aequorivita sp. S2608]MDS1299081.1 hypothetical protein [Aequorivita sp. S2608]
MRKFKTVIIHSDYKFVSASKCFETPYLENTIVIIKRLGEEYKGPYQNSAVFIEKHEKNKLLQLCQEADLVVMYGLYHFNSTVVLELPKSIKIIWRLLGYELYSKKLDLFVSDLTKEFVDLPEQLSFLKKIYRVARYGYIDNPTFYKAVKRVDFMMAICQEEYDFLQGHFKNLPKFIKVPHPQLGEKFKPKAPKTRSQKPIILLGNSRHAFNNHLDLIALVDSVQVKHRYSFKLLSSYGPTTAYYNALKKATADKPYYQLVEKFLELDEFKDFYANVDALVINTYRQMAVGNILYGVKNGTKIYLNKKNTIYKWLRNEGFIIYTIENFKNDLKTGNFCLAADKAEHNIKLSIALEEKYSVESFQQLLLKKVLYLQK